MVSQISISLPVDAAPPSSPKLTPRSPQSADNAGQKLPRVAMF
jgi:hypothetical protein